MTYTRLDIDNWPVDDVLHCVCGNRHPLRYTDKFVFEVGWSWEDENGDIARCSVCRKTVRSKNVVVPLHPAMQWAAMDLKAVKNTEWFHYTSEPSWPKFKKYYRDQKITNFYAHVGTYSAALDRAVAMAYPDLKPDGVIYRVRVKPNARWALDVAMDDDVIHPHACGPEDFEAIRYLNRFESPGSISLAVCNDLIEVVGTVDNWRGDLRGRAA